MEIFKNKIKINEPLLKRFIINNTAHELSKLTVPCYYPKTKKLYHELLKILNVSDSDTKEFIKRIYKGTKVEQWKTKLWTDPLTVLMIFIMHFFLNKRDMRSYSSSMAYFVIIHYSRIMHLYIKYCYEDTFKYTLDTITKTHLFVREKTIPNSLYFLSTQLQHNFERGIKEWDIENIIAFLSSTRTRISQSAKSFASHYYENRKEGYGIKTQIDVDSENKSNIYQQQTLERGQKVIDDIIKDLTMYKIINRKAFDEAKSITKINTSIATIISNELSSNAHINNIKISLQLFIKDINNVNSLCSQEFYQYTKKLMGIKRSIPQLYFKVQINILLTEILKNTNLLNTYEKYTSQTKFLISSFLAFYLVLLLRQKLC